MKKTLQLLSVLCALLVSQSVFAQLPDGSSAPDFTSTDINGNEHHLQSYLDDGYSILMDVSATWCGPCWSYHNTHVLEDIHNLLGPDGADKVIVMMIEGDETTTLEDIQGTGGNTAGDWTNGVTYPIIDDAGIADAYEITYFPTLYKICPDGIVTEIGQAALGTWIDELLAGCDNPASVALPSITSYTGDGASCGEAGISIEVTNYGAVAVESATFDVTVGGTVVASDVAWSGMLGEGGVESIDLGSTTETGEVLVEMTSMNGADYNGSIGSMIVPAAEGTTHVRIWLGADNWSNAETSWELVNSSGLVAAFAPVGTYQNNTEYVEDYYLPEDCYTFRFMDVYGDGLMASQWGDYEDGYVNVVTMADGGVEIASTIWEYDGSYNFAEAVAGFNANTVVSTEEISVNASFDVYPNPVNNIANLVFSAGLASDVTVDVYNVVGERVFTQDLGSVSGEQRIELDFASYEAGLYIVSLTANGEVATKRITLTK